MVLSFSVILVWISQKKNFSLSPCGKKRHKNRKKDTDCPLVIMEMHLNFIFHGYFAF